MSCKTEKAPVLGLFLFVDFKAQIGSGDALVKLIDNFSNTRAHPAQNKIA
jgi:hypothetical protein